MWKSLVPGFVNYARVLLYKVNLMYTINQVKKVKLYKFYELFLLVRYKNSRLSQHLSPNTFSHNKSRSNAPGLIPPKRSDLDTFHAALFEIFALFYVKSS